MDITTCEIQFINVKGSRPCEQTKLTDRLTGQFISHARHPLLRFSQFRLYSMYASQKLILGIEIGIQAGPFDCAKLPVYKKDCQLTM